MSSARILTALLAGQSAVTSSLDRRQRPDQDWMWAEPHWGQKVSGRTEMWTGKDETDRTSYWWQQCPWCCDYHTCRPCFPRCSQETRNICKETGCVCQYAGCTHTNGRVKVHLCITRTHMPMEEQLASALDAGKLHVPAALSRWIL